eukprot:243584_1
MHLFINDMQHMQHMLVKSIIKEDCKRTAHAIFVKGYNHESARIHNIHNVCGHHKYKSIKSFISSIQDSVTQQKSTEDNEINDMFNNNIIDLIGAGCCKQCSLYIALKVKQILRVGLEYNIGTYLHEKYYIQTVDFDRDQYHITILRIYFTNCLQYFQIADLILNKSDLWIHLFMLLQLNIHMVDAKVNTYCKYEQTQKQYMIEDLAKEYQQLTLLLFQIIRNICLFQEFHWKCIVSDRFKYIETWQKFVQNQLNHKLFSEGKVAGWGMPCIRCFFILICYALKYMKHSSSNYKRIHLWFSHLKQNIIFDSISMMQKFSLLLDSEYAGELLKWFDGFAKQVCQKKWNTMQCQNGKCNRKRCDRKNRKFYKCKMCRIARYCSKKCQKYDWNKGHHKLYCKQLREMKKDSKKAQQYLIE